MKLRATDSFHASGLGMVHKGTEFEAHDALGKELTDKGLASVIEESTDTAAGAAATDKAAPKSAPPPLNKMDVPTTTKRAAKAKEE